MLFQNSLSGKYFRLLRKETFCLKEFNTFHPKHFFLSLQSPLHFQSFYVFFTVNTREKKTKQPSSKSSSSLQNTDLKKMQIQRLVLIYISNYPLYEKLQWFKLFILTLT